MFSRVVLRNLIRVYQNPLRQSPARCFSDQSSVGGEQLLARILRERFPEAKVIEVQDISGGCGAMYDIYVQSSSFKGLNTIKQHRLVNDALKEQIKEMHGIRIQTAAESS